MREKMRFLFALSFILALSLHQVMAQFKTNYADSLLQVLKQAKEDTVKARALMGPIDQVLLGQYVMSEEVKQIVFSQPESSRHIPRLTRREKEILYWISKGITTQAIAAKLFISIQTVETHRFNLLQKFEAPNAVVLVKKALELGMLDEPSNDKNKA